MLRVRPVEGGTSCAARIDERPNLERCRVVLPRAPRTPAADFGLLREHLGAGEGQGPIRSSFQIIGERRFIGRRSPRLGVDMLLQSVE